MHARRGTEKGVVKSLVLSDLLAKELAKHHKRAVCSFLSGRGLILCEKTVRVYCIRSILHNIVDHMCTLGSQCDRLTEKMSIS